MQRIWFVPLCPPCLWYLIDLTFSRQVRVVCFVLIQRHAFEPRSLLSCFCSSAVWFWFHLVFVHSFRKLQGHIVMSNHNWFSQVLRAIPAETMVDGLPRVSSYPNRNTIYCCIALFRIMIPFGKLQNPVCSKPSSRITYHRKHICPQNKLSHSIQQTHLGTVLHWQLAIKSLIAWIKWTIE